MATDQEPKIGLNLERKTTQLNLWMIVGIVLFVVVSAILITRVLRHPPTSTLEMKKGAFNHRYEGVWARAVC